MATFTWSFGPFWSKQVNQPVLTAFQTEESYVQTHVASGKINQELANALNAQIALDQLSYIQSAD